MRNNVAQETKCSPKPNGKKERQKDRKTERQNEREREMKQQQQPVNARLTTIGLSEKMDPVLVGRIESARNEK